MEVIPLKYGTIFKRAFSQPDVFCQFVEDVLGIRLNIDKVHIDYEYPEPIGFIHSKYDLFAEDAEQGITVEIQQVKEENDFFDRFLYCRLISLAEQVGGYEEYKFDRTVYTIVLLTSPPDGSNIDFSYALNDMSPIDEHGNRISVYPHRLLFLCPNQVNDKTPPMVRKWLDFIEDSMDGEMDESAYQETLLQKLMAIIHKKNIDPAILSEIEDDAAWQQAKKRFIKEGRRVTGREKGIQVQLRQSILHARKMGLNDAKIAKLAGLTEMEINKIKE